MKRITILIYTTLIFCVTNAFAQFTGGDGTVINPYQISTPNDLETLSNQIQINQALYFDKHYIQTANIDASGLINFSAIHPFIGNYNGQNHIINNLTINNSPLYFGLFSFSSGNIENLGLENITVNGQVEQTGALVGRNEGTITNCYSTGQVTNTVHTTGGLVGENAGTISRCYSTANIQCNVMSGGLVGVNSGSVADCYSMGTISGQFDIGGLIGINVNLTTNCYSTGKATGTLRVGGLIGSNPANASNCYWDTKTSGIVIGAGALSTTGITPYTSAQMKNQSNFPNWNFAGTWLIDGITNNGYPYLSWQPAIAPPVPFNWHYMLLLFIFMAGMVMYRKIR